MATKPNSKSKTKHEDEETATGLTDIESSDDEETEKTEETEETDDSSEEGEEEEETDESESDEDEPKPKPSSKRFSNYEYKNQTMTVDISNEDNQYDKTFINSVRRIILAELPNFAMDYETTKIHKNTSMLQDDFLIQRLCLLPLQYTIFTKFDDVTVYYDHTNTTEDTIEIYNGDFKANTADGTPIPIKDIFTSTEFLFGKLRPEQRLSFTSKVTKSIPRKSGAHMMMASTSTYWFKHDTEALKKIMSSITPKDTKQIIKEKVTSVYNSEAIEMVIDTIDEDEDPDVIRSSLEDLVYLKNDKNEPAFYTFRLEDKNSLPAPEMFKVALAVFKKKIADLIHATKMKNTEKIEIFKSDTNIGSYQFDIQGEDFTLSYLMQHYFMRDNVYDYVGTIKPSPMKDMFIFRTHLKKDHTLENNRKQFIKNLERLEKLVDDFKSSINF